jgi:hypothetical protein
MKLTAQVVIEFECTLNPHYTSLVDLKREAIAEACNELNRIVASNPNIIKILGCQKVVLSLDNTLGTA